MSRIRKHQGSRYKNAKFLIALGRHFKKLRTKRGFSLDRLAREGEKLSRGSLHRLETGSGDVQVSLLYRIAVVLEIPPKELLNFLTPDED